MNQNPILTAHIRVENEGPDLHATCTVCGGTIDVPNKGMGRAILGTWKTRHQGDCAA